ncbi:MAG: molybdopterin converting factor subunit 1 [Bacillota bacterium]
MKLHLRLFAAAADATGARRLDWELPDGATVADLRQALAERLPGLARLAPLVMVAVNREYVQPDHALRDGDEVALIPPVSGGEPGDEPSVCRDETGRYEVTPEVLSGDVVASRVVNPHTGAAVVFLGTVREFTGDRRTVRLEYEAFAEMAVQQMKQIGSEVEARWQGARVAMSHRVGPLDISEVSVAIAVATPHRADAFEACRYAIDRLKKVVPIWKKEVWSDGSEWVGSQTGPA